MISAVAAAFARELAALRAEVAAYPDDASCFAVVPGLPNSGGTLARHCAGNVRHFIGHVLGGSGYVRDREGEFSGTIVPRAQLDSWLAAAEHEAAQAFAAFDPAGLDAPWPATLPDALPYSVRTFLQHLTSHLAYHLGQVDYHRRLVTGDARGVGAMAAGGLAAAWPAHGSPAGHGVSYEVTATMRAELMPAYLAWLTPGHVKDVVATGCFTHARVTQLDAERVRVAYAAVDAAAVDRYVAEFAAALRAKGRAAFPEGVTWSREVGRVIA